MKISTHSITINETFQQSVDSGNTNECFMMEIQFSEGMKYMKSPHSGDSN
jgi:hypothetical protein